MGAVYRKTRTVGQKAGRIIYNWHRLHKAGHKPKHKDKHRVIMDQMDKEIREFTGKK